MPIPDYYTCPGCGHEYKFSLDYTSGKLPNDQPLDYNCDCGRTNTVKAGVVVGSHVRIYDQGEVYKL